MVEIKDGKVYNPRTKRWVLATGKAGKAVIAELESKPSDESPVVGKKVEVSSFVKEKLKKNLEASRKRISMIKGKYYINKEHEAACKTGSWKNFKEPLVSMTGKAVYPLYQLVYNSPKDLDKPVFRLIQSGQPSLNEVELEYNNYMKDTIKEIGIINDPDNLHMEWVNAQNKYIQNLNKHDLFTLVGNCNHSHYWCNVFLRGDWKYNLHYRLECDSVAMYRQGKYYFPVFYQMKKLILDKSIDVKDISTDTKTQKIITSIRNTPAMLDSLMYVKVFDIAPKLSEGFVRRSLTIYCDDLERIIKAAPPIDTIMKVFRGTRHDIFEGSINQYYKNIGFISTSFDAFWSFRYVGLQCCFQEIKLLKGVKAVLVTGLNPYGGEKEIILNHNSVYMIRKRNIRKVISKGLTGICIPNKNVLKTSEIIVIK
jgi:hypothetical protein